MPDKIELEEIKIDIKEILKILNGNGKLGIVPKINIMWAVGILFLSTFFIGVIGILIQYGFSRIHWG